MNISRMFTSMTLKNPPGQRRNSLSLKKMKKEWMKMKINKVSIVDLIKVGAKWAKHYISLEAATIKTKIIKNYMFSTLKKLNGN